MSVPCIVTASALSATAFLLMAAPAPEHADTHVLAISPSYFECVHCESFHRHRQFLERQYPGLKVSEIKVSQEGAQALGIKGFPTIIVGEQLIGYGTEQRKRLQEILDRQ